MDARATNSWPQPMQRSMLQKSLAATGFHRHRLRAKPQPKTRANTKGTKEKEEVTQENKIVIVTSAVCLVAFVFALSFEPNPKSDRKYPICTQLSCSRSAKATTNS